MSRDPLREQIFRYCLGKRATVLRIHEVDKLSRAGKKIGRVTLVITNFACEFLNVTHKKIETNECHSWFTISKIAIRNDNVVTLGFRDGEMIFESDKSENIASLAIKYVQRILTPSELALVSIPNSFGISVKANQSSIAFRLFYHFHDANLSQDSPAMRNIVNALRLRARRIDRLEFGRESNRALPIFLECLSMNNKIRQLGFTENNGKRLFAILAQYLPCLEQIRHFTFAQPLTREFCDAVLRTETKLRGITFDGTIQDTQQVSLIGSLLNAGRINSIGFKGGLDAETAHMVTEMGEFRRAKFLELSDIRGLTLSRLTPTLNRLLVLNISSCGIVIGDFLKEASDFVHLQTLNISGNRGIRIGQKPGLPPALVKIYADDVQWDGTSLVSFLRMSVSSQQLVCLSVARMMLDRDEFRNVNKALSQMKGKRLETLIWDGNRLTKEFFSFLEKQQNLTYLSISQCLTRDTFGLLLNFFKTSRNIAHLNMKGLTQPDYIAKIKEHETILFPDMDQLFFLLGKNQVIMALDVTFHLLDENSLEALAELARHSKSLKFLAFDGTSVSSIAAINQFCSTVETRESAINVTYPALDVSRLESAHRDNQILIEKLKHRFRNLRREKWSRKPFPKILKPFMRPFDIFYGNIDEKFVDYLPEEAERELPIMPEPKKKLKRKTKRKIPPPQELSMSDENYSIAESEDEFVMLSETPAVREDDESQVMGSTEMETEKPIPPIRNSRKQARTSVVANPRSSIEQPPVPVRKEKVPKPPPKTSTIPKARRASSARIRALLSEANQSSNVFYEDSPVFAPKAQTQQKVPSPVLISKREESFSEDSFNQQQSGSFSSESDHPVLNPKPKPPLRQEKPRMSRRSTGKSEESDVKITRSRPSQSEMNRSSHQSKPERLVPKKKPVLDVDWSFPIRFVPEINNSAPIESLESRFEMEKLLSTLNRDHPVT